MKLLEQEAKEVFEVHSQLDTIYMTSDGVAYQSEHNALQRAKELGGEVVKFERNQFFKSENKISEKTDEGFNEELNEGDVYVEVSAPKNDVKPKNKSKKGNK